MSYGEARGVHIELSGIRTAFGEHEVLRDVSLRVGPGQVHFVLGRSGVGKSVLIKQIVGLLRPNAGSIRLDGQEVTRFSEEQFVAVREQCQLIFQHATLFDALTVRENVAMPVRKRFRVHDAEARRRADAVLAQVHAGQLADRRPSELGAGVRKRVAIARALALEPRALLYDEPTTSLDPVSARRIDRLIRETAQRLQVTSLVVSHDLVSLAQIADAVTFLHAGGVRFAGAASALWHSRDPAVREFLAGGCGQ